MVSPKDGPHDAPLSIIDATVARFTPTSATWLFDRPPDSDLIHTDTLARSLRATLDAYPQLAGQLHWAPYDASGRSGHTRRYGRMMLRYGAPDDPGVELVQARSAQVLADVVPHFDTRAAAGCWDASAVPTLALLPDEPPVALHDRTTYAGLPCAVVQLTTFACGALAVAVKMAHPVADAQALITFARDWAAVNRAMVAGAPAPVLEPVFDPQRLDAAAAGDIDADAPDPDVVRKARALPLHRYDWWAGDASAVPAELATSARLEPPGRALPWAEWDLAAPFMHNLLYFSPAEVEGMLRAAGAAAGVSRLDALLAHVWALIVRARGLQDNVEVYLDVTLGLRQRVAPPLPDSFMGSPIVLTHAALPASTISSQPSKVAASIREAMAQFTPDAVAALLHERAFASCPHRFWDAFLGARHTIVTSWLRLDVYELDFGFGGGRARYVDALMPEVDGCLHVMEAGPRSGGGSTKWYGETVCVSLHLAEDDMARVLSDPLLRAYNLDE
ncbi:hypothetical protein AURDEDRAFT_154155 [Auricularia subglabra TFB-10046 SS5]|nr:hypothetical protein AURDEDRAFT_154155 [Auricularia subglabra TFB-10046 SS5]